MEAGGQLLSEREKPQVAGLSIEPRWLHGQHRPQDGDADPPHDGDPDRTNGKALHAFT
jgi:hypothetical protein